MTRAGWDDYFLGIAEQVAARSTCKHAWAGAVLVRNNTIISTGYGGSIRGAAHCNTVGHQMVGSDEAILVVRRWSRRDYPKLEDDLRANLDRCVRAVHAEANAIAQAARSGA